jgi:hypothetical protein
MLEIDLRVPGEISAGETLDIELRVRNPGPDSAVLLLPGGELAFDVTVRSVEGVTIWNRLHGIEVPMVLEMRPIAPDEVVSFHALWKQCDMSGRQVSPGTYHLHAVLRSEEMELPARPSSITISAH